MSPLTRSELDALKVFTTIWLETYACMPPEVLLWFFVVITRIHAHLVAHVARQSAKVSAISITQVQTVDDFARRVRVIAEQSQMGSRW